MGLYKRAASLRDLHEVDSLMIEITDRFGRPPEEVIYFLEVIKLKILCMKIGVEKIDSGPKAVVMQFGEVPKISAEEIIRYVEENSDRIKIKPGNKLVFENSGNTIEATIFQVQVDLNNMAEIVSRETLQKIA